MQNLLPDGLGAAAATVDDLEKLRCATANRLRLLTVPIDKPDDDGVCRGLGLREDHLMVKATTKVLERLKELEADAVADLEKEMKLSAFGPWIKTRRGVGFKQVARLLAVIDDPSWNGLHERNRKPSELWAYAGLHVVDGHAPRREKGHRANWSEDARKRAFLISESCLKQLAPSCRVPEFNEETGELVPIVRHVEDCVCSPYRLVYDATRQKYADAVHADKCVRCGPEGKPALPGSPLSAGHRHARAIRAMSKALLIDLWVEARRLHGIDDAA
jgi:hypothetical protein